MNTFTIILCFVPIIMVLPISFYLMVLNDELRSILNAEDIPTGYFAFYFSYDKFKQFLETYQGDEDKKKEYTLLYKKAVKCKQLIHFIVLVCFLISILIFLW